MSVIPITIIVPSRGRPERMKAMAASAWDTAENAPVIVAVIDSDDPCKREYTQGEERRYITHEMDRAGYTGALNAVAAMFWDVDGAILGAFGDDVLFRTPGWDQLIEEALETPGIAYGNDLVHASGHPTAIFMSSVIAKALGYLAIPQSRHLWVDDAWKKLGQMTDTLRYVPEVIVEHMHPVVGKAEMDQTYHEVYDSVLGHQDHLGFQDWEANHAEADAAKVRAAIGA